LQPFGISSGPIDSETYVVEPRGEIDLATAGLVSAPLEEAIEIKALRVIVDLGDVTFIESTGVGVLLSAERLLQAHGGILIVACATPSVRRVFEITGLDSVLRLTSSRREALAPAQELAPAPG
jgi:anti-sigma B factor antagonist